VRGFRVSHPYFDISAGCIEKTNINCLDCTYTIYTARINLSRIFFRNSWGDKTGLKLVVIFGVVRPTHTMNTYLNEVNAARNFGIGKKQRSSIRKLLFFFWGSRCGIISSTPFFY